MKGHLALIALVTGLMLLAACSTPQAQQPASPATPAAAPTKAAQTSTAPTTAPAAQPSSPTSAPAAKPSGTIIELRVGCSTPKGGPEADAIDRLAELVSAKTNGQVKIVNLYNSLGVEMQLAEQVMAGSMDMGSIASGNTSRWTTALAFYDLPFLFKSNEAALDSTELPGTRPAIDMFEKDLGVKFLFAISAGSGRDVQTRRKQLLVPDDIKGLKIRTVASPMDLSTFKAWGANPTPVDWGQTYTALQQGVVDGEGISLAAVLSNKHYEVVKYSLRIDYQPLMEILYISSKKFAALSAQHQQALLEAAQEAKVWNRKHEADRLGDTQKQLTELGMTIYTPNEAEKTQWMAIRDSVWKQVEGEMKGKLDFDLARKLAGQ